ncbi:MAG: dephospho-CoA kinase [Deltaproteobacteria bacterium]|jgi:dephospho-CoA kinase|nr:dephospho-CoA kinase [Deltaproteobacteria bacterium]MBW2541989.1 dephospho-CoA kinase [Deltaproteobacteria bacterium]
MASVLGLSGGIATGKSTVARFLSALGASVIDADAIVHELQAPGTPLLDEIAEAFGSELIDAEGGLDRNALGAIVFSDPAARKRLEAIVHPAVLATMADRVASAQATDTPLIVLDIPLLFERGENGSRRGPTSSFDATVLVYAPEQLQIERLMERDGCDREAALQRIRAQMPIESKKSMADIVIDNSGSLEATRNQTQMLFERFSAVRP